MLAFVTVPIIHIYKTKSREHRYETVVPHGYTNDASQLNLTRVDTIISIATAKAEMEVQIRELIQQAKGRNIPISTAGAKHSMGGHTMYPGSPFNCGHHSA